MSDNQNDIEQLMTAISRGMAETEESDRLLNAQDIAEELAAEFRDEYCVSWAKGGRRKKQTLPDDNVPVTLHSDGTVWCRYDDDEWRTWVNGINLSVNFRRRHENDIDTIDFSGSLANHIVRFTKTIAYFSLPGNNPFSGIRSYGSSIYTIKRFQLLAAYLMNKGYLLNLDGVDPTPLRLLDADTIKRELRDRMALNMPAAHVAGMFRAVARWLQTNEYVELPDEFCPGFTIADWQGDTKLTKEIIKYEAERITPWQAIPHDELLILLQECQVFTQDFSDDILFMYRKLKEADALFPGRRVVVESAGRGRPIMEALKSHKFNNDPRTGAPWFEIKITPPTIRTELRPGNGSPVVRGCPSERLNREPCYKEFHKLTDCCVFLLTLWSAARVQELVNIKVDSLFINNKRLNPLADAVECFKSAKGKDGTLKPRFELEFRTFKTSKLEAGKYRRIPLATDAAYAFCLLVELLRSYRTANNSPYLLPAGLSGHGKMPKHGKLETSTQTKQIAKMIRRLCQRVGVTKHHPHRCRKTLATIIINKNPQSLELIQRLLGHHTPNMTLRYLMEIPGIAEPIRQHIIQTNKERITELLKGAASRRLSGEGAVSIMEAIPLEKLAAEVLPDTIQAYVDIISEDPNFVITTAPAAFCLRIWKNMPENVPCLPRQDMVSVPIQDLAPDPSLCNPSVCGYILHTSRHLDRARRNRNAAQKLANQGGVRAELAAAFALQAEYWGKVVRDLEDGNSIFHQLGNTGVPGSDT